MCTNALIPVGSTTHFLQAPTNFAQAQAIEADPPENEPNDTRFFLDHFEACYAAAVAAVDVAISKTRPSKCADRTRARSVATTATTALQNLGAFIFGNHALNLEQEIILRRNPDRPVQKHDVHAGTPKLVDEQRLMGVAPSQAIRGMDIQALDLAASGRITKSLERRAYKDRAAEAFVDITIIWFEHKAIGCDTLAQ